MRRRFAIVALVVAATLPAARLSADARASQAPSPQPSAPVQSPASQKPPAPAGQAPKPAQPPDKPAPTAQTAQATPEKTPAEPGALVFASNAGMVFSAIKPGQETAYEEVLGKVQEALAKSVDPVRKQQAASWKVYKATEPFQDNTLYISVMDPAVAGANYNVFLILQETYGDIAAREIFEKFRNAHAGGQNVTNLTPVFVMSTGKVAVPK